jgi:hypothetical protein
MVVRDAISLQILDKHEEDRWVEQYRKDPEFVKQHIEDHRYRAVLAKQMSLHGEREVTEADPLAEVEAKAAELMAKDDSFRGKPAAARIEVLKRDPKLSERYREKHTVGLAGGEN